MGYVNSENLAEPGSAWTGQRFVPTQAMRCPAKKQKRQDRPPAVLGSYLWPTYRG